MRVTSRLERKYHLNISQYLQVKNSLRAYMQPDSYTTAGGGSYLVRSLYYDSHDFAAYHERNNGNFGRIKLRIRSYTDDPGSKPMILIELKTKKGCSMEKYSSFVPYSRYQTFLVQNTWNCPADPVLIEFERLVRTRALAPILLVQYQREGFSARDRCPVRVTLDQNIHSTRAHELYPTGKLLKPHRPKRIILEIKSRSGDEPDWLRHIVRHHSLKLVSNSKYVQGIEIIRPNMATPRITD